MDKITFKQQLIIAIVGGISLAACTTTTAAQSTYDSMSSALNSLSSQSISCLNAVDTAHPKTDKIFSPENKSRVKKENKKTEAAALSERMKCRKQEYEQTKNHPDYYVRSFAPVLKESMDLRNDVYNKYLGGKITGSEGYSSLKNISEYLGAKWDTHNQQIVNQLNQQDFQGRQAQAAMLQAIGAGFKDYSNQQQQYYQQRQMNSSRSVYTQCQWVGNIMSCTSY